MCSLGWYNAEFEREKNKAEQGTGYMNTICQLSSLKKVTIRDNVS